MKSLLFVLSLLVATQRVKALDPFFPPDDWNAYQERVIKDREHEKPGWRRPVPGTSPAVAIQTLILPEFEVENVPLEVAFQAWQDACRQGGVNVRVYLEPAALINRPSITHSAKGETAARALAFIENLGLARVKLLEDHFLAGANSLDPHERRFRVWLLSEMAARFLELHKLKPAQAGWCSADAALTKIGAALPPGTYADYHEQTRALVAINTTVTLDALSEWIEEMEARAIIQQFKDKDEVQMDGYRLAVRSQQLDASNAAKIAARLRDAKDRLAPFAASSKTWAESRGLITPAGSAVWLDVASSTLWLRSRPECLDQFMPQLQKANLEK